MDNPNQTKAKTVSFWRAVELFSHQPAPRIDPGNKTDPVFGITPQSLAPWDPEHPLQRRIIRDNQIWRHQVYGGIFSLGKVLQVLEDKIGRDPDTPGDYPQQEGAVCTFTVSNEGRPLLDTLVVSTCAWVSARTMSPGPHSQEWLTGFEELEDRIRHRFLATLSEPAQSVEDEALPASVEALTGPQLFREIEQVILQLGAHHFLDHCEIRVKSYLVSKKRRDVVDETDSLNSFFTADLARVAGEVHVGNLGPGLAQLLSGHAVRERIDLRKDNERVSKLLAPHCFPRGRWPSAVSRPLFLSQQLAVNHIMTWLATRAGISSVNGPPGTGKTTLIRDLVAAIVVERARVLATLAHPRDAFAGRSDSWSEGGYTRTVNFLIERLRGFEIVVASNNNGAVENVVMEIPGSGAIDSSFLTDDFYFADVAGQLLNQPAWALVATRLGNRTNRNAFVSQFRYGGNGFGEARSQNGFLDYLKNQQYITTPLDWRKAVQRFRSALIREDELRQQRVAMQQLTLEVKPRQRQLVELDQQLAERVVARDALATEADEAQRKVTEVEAAIARAIEDRRLHFEFQPNIWQIIFTFGKAMREWRAKDATLQAQIDGVREAQTRLQTSLEDLQSRVQAVEVNVSELRQQRNLAQTQLERTREQLAKAEQLIGRHLLWPEVLADPQARELHQPWGDASWNQARTELFVEALRLHKAFLLGSAQQIRDNLFVAMDILSGKVPQRLPPGAARDAWATLFLVIPVISTTFASFDRLFRHLGREEIGWLLIDEGGQASPQSAVGAIWRAKRSVVLGDPLQLEPVVTLPLSVQQALRRCFGVDEKWLPGKTSLQQLADEVNPLGTRVDLRDGVMWVGSPLRVHKRCDQPMFDISNHIAYGGQMVFDTPSRPALALRPSMWLDVASELADDHWIPAEGKRLQQLLQELRECDVQPGDIMLLSPFRSVARQLQRLATKSDMRAGTIHVAQGREADVVILVLGGNPDRPGAKRWASSRPNLLNVAASRAKRRLYIIGDQKSWSRYPYFSDVSALLTRSEAVEEVVTLYT